MDTLRSLSEIEQFPRWQAAIFLFAVERATLGLPLNNSVSLRDACAKTRTASPRVLTARAKLVPNVHEDDNEHDEYTSRQVKRLAAGTASLYSRMVSYA
jgi:hypothetical protein